MADAIATCEKMKNLLLILFICAVLSSSAQNISGIYSGTIKNDSLKMTQNYELALSEYKGKITGYSYITFVKNDTFYYGIKRIKAIREKGQLVVEDEEMLMNNYPQRPDKGVHLINYFPLTQGDSVLDLNGTWKTTESKKHRFYSIGGNMSLRRDDDSSNSALISHLKELKVINYQDDKRAIAKTDRKQTSGEKPTKTEQDVTVTQETKLKDVPSAKSSATHQNNSVTTPSQTAVAANIKQTNKAIQEPSQSSLPEKRDQNEKAVVKETSSKDIAVHPNPIKDPKQETGSETPSLKPQAISAASSADKKATISETAIAKTDKKELILSPLEKRISNTIQTVTVTSDSLILSFYDNGIVDGDSISVYVNNENIISKVKLTEAAAKKTVYTTTNNDDIKITLVAESLGSIPPNTGLLIIQDGDQRYNIRFSADMETNASIILKKKKR